MSNTTYDLGRVGLNLRGEYDSTAAYEPLDVATWQGSSYVASESTTGIRPSDEEKWTMLAQGTVSPICMEEQRTGLYWINGKPIYAKMFMLPAPPTANASLEYYCDFSGMEDVWIDPSNTFLRRKDNAGTYHAGYIASDAGRQFCVMPNKSTGVLIVVSDSEGTVYVRLLYTKAADTAMKYQLPFLNANNDQGCIITASSQANNTYPCRCELRDFFAKRLLLIRDELDLTQMEFALDLGIDRRSYHDLENKKFLCCALTLLVYLCFFCDDPLAVLRECKDIIKKHHVVKHSPFH